MHPYAKYFVQTLSGVRPALWLFMLFSILIPFSGIVSFPVALFFLVLKPIPIALYASRSHLRERYSTLS